MPDKTLGQTLATQLRKAANGIEDIERECKRSMRKSPLLRPVVLEVEEAWRNVPSMEEVMAQVKQVETTVRDYFNGSQTKVESVEYEADEVVIGPIFDDLQHAIGNTYQCARLERTLGFVPGRLRRIATGDTKPSLDEVAALMRWDRTLTLRLIEFYAQEKED